MIVLRDVLQYTHVSPYDRSYIETIGATSDKNKSDKENI
jgi:hypothetical protein